MLSVAMLASVLRASWGPDTCDPVDLADWRPDNPARGQCGVTALVLHDLLGGDLLLGEVVAGAESTGVHYWNRLPDGTEVDLTADQFRPDEAVGGGRVQPRPPGPPRRCGEQYELLRARTLAGVLTTLVRSSPWLMAGLRSLRSAQVPDAWIGGGVLRDLVWGELHGAGFDPTAVRDVDVAFFDPTDLRRAHDDRVTALLARRAPRVPWQARNQAAVHTWYQQRFGGEPVDAFASIEEAVASFPETATAVAVRLAEDGTVEVCAPLGLADLVQGVWRRNPRRVSLAVSRQRLARHDPALRWPGVTVVAPG